jgi:hypothetical protein
MPVILAAGRFDTAAFIPILPGLFLPVRFGDLARPGFRRTKC